MHRDRPLQGVAALQRRVTQWSHRKGEDRQYLFQRVENIVVGIKEEVREHVREHVREKVREQVREQVREHAGLASGTGSNPHVIAKAHRLRASYCTKDMMS